MAAAGWEALVAAVAAWAGLAAQGAAGWVTVALVVGWAQEEGWAMAAAAPEAAGWAPAAAGRAAAGWAPAAAGRAAAGWAMAAAARAAAARAARVKVAAASVATASGSRHCNG